MNKKAEPNFEALQKILATDLNRKVTVDEARRIGTWLLRFYSHLIT